MDTNKQNKIKLLLKSSGIKQKLIAGEIGVSPQAVNQVVLGRRSNPRIRQAIAKSIGKTVEEVFQESTPTPLEANG